MTYLPTRPAIRHCPDCTSMLAGNEECPNHPGRTFVARLRRVGAAVRFALDSAGARRWQ